NTDFKKNSLQQKFNAYDSTTMPYQKHNELTHFALTETLIKKAEHTNEAMIHFWQTDPLVILGMMDTRLPYFKKALTRLDERHYPYVIRNSGGLAIVSDPGILNVSLILPITTHSMNITTGYEI